MWSKANRLVCVLAMNLEWCSRLDPCLIEILKNELNHPRMTIVQSAAIPIILDNKDVCVEACTGSGKSLTFILPALQLLINRFNRDKRSFTKHTAAVLIVSPTRELTNQLYKLIKQILSIEPLRSMFSCLLLVGGKNPVFDVQSFKKNGGNLILTTPGRFLEVKERSDLFAKQIKDCLELLVLDEADMLLQLGFQDSLNKIFDFLPKQRRTGLFSATMTKRIDMLIKVGLRNPVRIEIKEKRNQSNDVGNQLKQETRKKDKERANFEEDETAKEVNLDANASQSVESTGLQISPYLQNNYLILPSLKYKLPFLVDFINRNLEKKIIVFFATCSQINFYSVSIKEHLDERAQLLCLHRKLDYRRQKVFNLFKDCQTGCVLFCTDVMSRGIDVPSVDWVINFDLPNDLQTFIHRSGRSGHCIGVQGRSLTLCLEHEFKFIQLCQQKSMSISDYASNYRFKLDSIEKLKSDLNSAIKDQTRLEYKHFEMGLKAFVSFIRNYSSKNILSGQLFRELDVMDAVNAFCLIKIPQMPELNGRLKGNMDRFEIEEADGLIAKEFKQRLVSLNSAKPGRKERRKEFEEKKKLRSKLKKMKYKKRRDYLNKMDMDELNADYSKVRKAKRRKIAENDLDF